MTATLDRPTPQGNPAKAFLRLVVIEHSVFALPFAYVAALTAMTLGHGHHGVHWVDLLLITVAMVSARTFAMAANRIVDRELDARNPRTASRELVTGAVSVRTAVIGSAVSIVIFLAAAAALNLLCLALSPIALFLLVLYPYGKRFTWFCHGILGIAQAVAPLGAWIAVTGHWSWAAAALGVGVGLWIGGFDLIYALQDMAHDRENGVALAARPVRSTGRAAREHGGARGDLRAFRRLRARRAPRGALVRRSRPGRGAVRLRAQHRHADGLVPA